MSPIQAAREQILGFGSATKLEQQKMMLAELEAMERARFERVGEYTRAERQVCLHGGPANGRLMRVAHGTAVINIPALSGPYTHVVSESADLYPIISTHRYDGYTGQYLGLDGARPQIPKVSTDKSGATEGNNDMTSQVCGRNAVIHVGDDTFEGVISRFDVSVDHFDVTSFGSAVQSSIPGEPRFSLSFEGRKATTNTPQTKEFGMELFEYAVIYLPEDNDGNVDKANAKIVLPPTTMLAKTQEAVKKTATRGLDAELDLDFVQVLVRPFGR